MGYLGRFQFSNSYLERISGIDCPNHPCLCYRVYQEALEEGREEGIEEAKLASVPRLSALGLNAEQIAHALELDIDRVRQAISSDRQ